MVTLALAVVATLLGAPPAGTATTSKTQRVTARTAKRLGIVIDGRRTEKAWQTAVRHTGFVQAEPDEGQPATEPTFVRVAYDETALYILVEARDSRPEKISGLLTRRDQDSASDWLHVWLDTYDDDRTAYRFSVNPRNVRRDARFIEGSDTDDNWNVVWASATRTSSTGWTAELRIPLSQIRYDTDVAQWGLQVERRLLRRAERSFLRLRPNEANRTVEYFATLDGMDRLSERWAITAVPYFSGGYQQVEGDATAFANLGAEGRIGLGRSLLLSVTLNPDFGQVEADPSVLNLGATELFFAERRPFFIEGRETLNMGIGFGDGGDGDALFYSRRIGANGPILGAVKITGKTSGGWQVGLLDAVFGGPSLTLQSRDLDDDASVPFANAAVARLTKELRRGNTTVGVGATHLARLLDADHVLDEDDPVASLRHAFSGVADLNHRVGQFEVLAKVFGSHVTGDKETITALQRSPVRYFQRPDAEHVEVDPSATSLSGWGANLSGGKFGGRTFRGAAGLMVRSPGFEPNALGFLPSVDEQIAWVWGQVGSQNPGPWHRRYNMNVNGWVSRTFGGDLVALGGNVNGWWQLPSQLELWLGVGRFGERYDTRLQRGGAAVRVPAGWESWFGASTDTRRSFVFRLNGNLSRVDQTGGGSARASITLTYRPTPSVEISAEPNISSSQSATQYVDTVDDTAVIGRLRQRTFSAWLRANLTLNPNVSLQIYAAPFFTAGVFSDFRRVVAPSAVRFDDRFAGFDYDGADRFVFGQIRSNVVLRWEYSLGSTFFFVWGHEQTFDNEDRGFLSTADDIGDVFSAPSSDTVMIKLSHFFEL